MTFQWPSSMLSNHAVAAIVAELPISSGKMRLPSIMGPENFIFSPDRGVPEKYTLRGNRRHGLSLGILSEHQARDGLS